MLAVFALPFALLLPTKDGNEPTRFGESLYDDARSSAFTALGGGVRGICRSMGVYECMLVMVSFDHTYVRA